MQASRTHNVGGVSISYSSPSSSLNEEKGKDRIVSLEDTKEKNWRGKIFQQFQLHGTQFFSELELNTYPSDFRDILNCLAKLRQTDQHLKEECKPFNKVDFEYKQSEIDEDETSKNLWEEIESTFGVMADEEYFVMYIPGFDIMMYRVGKKCDFFPMNRNETGVSKVKCQIVPNYVVKQHIEDTEKKSKPDGKQYIPVIGFYIH